MKTKLLSKKSFGLIASLLAAISLLAVATTPVFAKPISPLSVPSIRVNGGNTKSTYTDRLSALFSHEKTLFNNLRPGGVTHMTALNEAVETIPDSEKFDASVSNFDQQQQRELRERALAMQANTIKMEDLRVSEQVTLARNLIAAHPGFAENGDVANSAVALKTINTLNAYVVNIRYSINTANDGLTDALAGQGVAAGSLRKSAK
jgi:hypothetical protein